MFEINGLLNGVGAQVGEFPFRYFRPVFPIRAYFKLVFIRHAGGVSILSGQVGEAGNLVRFSHIHHKGLRRFRLGKP